LKTKWMQGTIFFTLLAIFSLAVVFMQFKVLSVSMNSEGDRENNVENEPKARKLGGPIFCKWPK